MSKNVLKGFDPNSAASGDGIFGLPFNEEQSQIVIIPVPWEATTSYGAGTSNGPAAILEASFQQDLFHAEIKDPWKSGIYMREIPKKIASLNKKAKLAAQTIIKKGGEIGKSKSLKKNLDFVNKASKEVNAWVKNQTTEVFSKNKIPVILGGDHAVPLGAFAAAAKKHGDFGVLHFDAHMDLRVAFEGFQYSHASIMHNALEEISEIKKLVQVGVRDFCEQEVEYATSNRTRIIQFSDKNVQDKKADAVSWSKIRKEIISHLPEKVWISFDIDGLDPALCPHTGTPVPSGLSYYEAVSLIQELAQSGKTIIGFDLVEVAHPQGKDEWDANVGMRLLYQMCVWAAATNKKQ